jgi:hypothetical protein
MMIDENAKDETKFETRTREGAEKGDEAELGQVDTRASADEAVVRRTIRLIHDCPP